MSRTESASSQPPSIHWIGQNRQVLMSADGAAVATEQLLEQVWDEHADPFSNAVAVTVLRLRRNSESRR